MMSRMDNIKEVLQARNECSIYKGEREQKYYDGEYNSNATRKFP